MPDSKESLEERLLRWHEEDIKRIDVLIETILSLGGNIPQETTVVVPEALEGIGKLPWYLKKQKLENHYAKVQSSSDGQYVEQGRSVINEE